MKKTLTLTEEPVWDNTHPDEFLRCVNWYRTNGKTTNAKKWTMEYLRKNKYPKKKIELINKCSNGAFDTVGIYCRISTRSDSPIPNEDGWKQKTNLLLDSLVEKGKKLASAKSETVQVDTTPKPSIQERMKEQVSEYIESLDRNIDRMVSSKETPVAVTDFLNKNEIKAPQSKMISEWYQTLLEELTVALEGKDGQLTEAYSFLKKTELRKFHKYVSDIVSICDEHCRLKTATRKPRRKKSKTPGQLTKNLKYQEKHDELGIQSVDPRKIIGAKKVVVFNTKYNILQIYETSALVDGLSVKGTTLVGFDEKKSVQRKVRDPKKIVKTCATSGIRAINNAYKSLTTKESLPTGRINANCVILQVFR